MLGRWEVHVEMGRRQPTSLEEALDIVQPRVVQAVRTAHEALERLGVRHVLVGGLAVGLLGRARATRDVDFLVGAEAFESSGALVSFKPGVPLSAHGVPVDSILAPSDHADVLEEALAAPVSRWGIPVIAPEYLLYMKLVAGRRQDLADVVAVLATSRVDVDKVRALLERGLPAVRDEFEQLLREATDPGRTDGR